MLQLISRYRACLMAFAILGVLFTHARTDFGLFALNRLAMLGYGGVDLFFFLSGFGLYFSCRKGLGARRFHARRMGRIYPAFLAALAIDALLRPGYTPLLFLKKASTLGFWLPTAWHWGVFAWFMSAILVFYLLFPPFFALMRRHAGHALAVAAGLTAVLCGAYAYYCFAVKPGSYNELILAFARIPVFALGAFFAHASACPARYAWLHSRRCAWWLGGVAAIAFAALNALLGCMDYFDLRNSALLYLPFALIIPGFCLGAAAALRHLPALHRPLAWIGGATLETYLLLGLFTWKQAWFVGLAGGHHTAGTLLMMAGNLLAGRLLHETVELLRNLPGRFQARRRQRL